MNKGRNTIVFIFKIFICLVIILLAVELFLFLNFTKKLPSLPEFSSVNPSLKEQIYLTNRKVRRFPSSDNIGSLGMVYNSGAFYDEAAQCYKLAIKRNNKKWAWSYYLGYLNLELGNAESAKEYFSNVIKENPKAHMALFYTGTACQNLNSVDSAEKIFIKIGGLNDPEFLIPKSSRTSYFPLTVYARFQLAGIYINSGRSELAENILKQIILSYITFGPAYRQLGNLYARSGDSTLTRYYTSRANDLTIYTPPPDTLIDKLSIMSRSDIFLMKQIDVAIRSANSQWAVELLTHGLKFFPDNKYFISKAIKQFLSVGMGDQALQYLDRHISFFGDDSGELIEVGRLLSDAGYKSQASRYFLKAESISKDKIEIQSELALLLVEKGLKGSGLDLINELLAKNPENLKILSDAAYLFLEINEKGKALQYLKKLKQLSPADNKVKILEGIIAEQEGKKEEAAILYENVLKADPKNIFVIDHLGNIYLRDKRWEKAISFFRKALVSYPNSSSLQEKLGGLLVACPDPEFRNIAEGREYSERAFINFSYTLPTRISAGRNLAIAWSESGDRKKAYSYIVSTIKLAEKANVSKEYLANLVSLSDEFLK